MKKNVYSLVLSEDVVHEIDKLAYQRGTNRSNMVNQILAEYASLITPEKRMSHLLAEVRRHFESAAGFQLPEAASAGMMNLRTALRYKYNPTVRYSLELSRDNQSIGTLRVSLRTQNTGGLIADYISTFDAALKLYFSEPEPDSRETKAKIERLYREYFERRNVAV